MKLKSKSHPFVRYIPTVVIFLLTAAILFFAVADINNTSSGEGFVIPILSI